jgi:hypothetical protein
MPEPGTAFVPRDDTAYYRSMSRGVRQAFLCCTDLFTHQSYDHRRQWISDRLKELIGCFSTDCCGYAVISNHYHLVLFVDHDAAKSLDSG